MSCASADQMLMDAFKLVRTLSCIREAGVFRCEPNFATLALDEFITNQMDLVAATIVACHTLVAT